MTTMKPDDYQHVRYYYLRNSGNHPFGCVCLIRDEDGKFFRGISICNTSKGDRFSKATARGLAYSRANRAFCNSMNNSAVSAAPTVGLSEELDTKLYWIQLTYGLGFNSTAKDVEKVPVHIYLEEAFVDLTPGEKQMWEDVLK